MQTDRRRDLPLVSVAIAALVIAGVSSVLIAQRERLGVHRAHGLTVRHPTGWQVANETLTPKLTDPREVVALGTSRLRPGGALCPHLPANAIADLGSGDALVWIAERSPDGPPAAHGFPARPARLPLSRELRNADGSQDCVPRKTFTSWWFPFGEQQRSFHVLVAFGPRASRTTQRQAWRVIEQLKVDAS